MSIPSKLNILASTMLPLKRRGVKKRYSKSFELLSLLTVSLG